MPATLAAEIGGSWYETSQGKRIRPYLKNKKHKTEVFGHSSSNRALA
jgi:hypothetical protein